MIIAKGKQIDWHPELTVREVLKTIGYDFDTIMVRVNKHVIPQADWDTFRVDDNAVLDVHPMVSGG